MVNDVRSTADSLGFPWTELFGLAPHLIWVGAALLVFLIIGPSSIKAILSRANRIRVGAVEIELRPEIDAIARRKSVQSSSSRLDRLERRLKSSASAIASARFLWIDDTPENNSKEIALLRKLGATVDIAPSDRQAKERLESAVYDVVLSDMLRHGNEEAGKELLPQIQRAMLSPSVIFYVGKPRDCPQGAFGLTVEFDELFILIIQALERREYRSAADE